VEGAPRELVRRLANLLGVLARAELPEVLRGFWDDILAQLHHNAASRLIANLHVKEHPRISADLERLVHGAARSIHLCLQPLVQRLTGLVLLLHLTPLIPVLDLRCTPRLRGLLVLGAPQGEDGRGVVEQRRLRWRH